MAINLIIKNCDLGQEVSIASGTLQGVIPVSWGGNTGQISISEHNYCPENVVITFRHAGVDAYVYVSQGLNDSESVFPKCSLSPNPDGSSYSGPVDEIVFDYTAAVYGMDLSCDTPGGNYSSWELTLSLSHTGGINTQIFYTLDGTDPLTSTSRQLYSDTAKITIGGDTLPANKIVYLRAIALDLSLEKASKELSLLYLFDRDIALVSSVPHGYHIDKSPIELTAITGLPHPVEIYYTTDGSPVLDSNGDPLPGALLYTGPITPPASEFTLRAVAVLDALLAQAYSNQIRDYHKYEEDVLILEATPNGGTFPDSSLVIYLNCNDAAAKITYTLDGSSPLGSNALVYSGPIRISTEQHLEEFTLRAIAVNGRLISSPLLANYMLYQPDLDADGDELSNLTEGGPNQDTDSDGIPDMLDADSDNDGMPDYIEGTVDADSDNIPAFQDSDERLPFWYAVTGLPPSGDLINGFQYEIKILCHGDTGYVRVISGSAALVFSETELVIPAGEEKVIYMLVPEVMENKCSPLWSAEPFDFSLEISHYVNGELVTEILSREYITKAYTDEIKYQGNLITWTKTKDAKFYNIYRKSAAGDTDAEYERIARVLHDSYHSKIPTQQFLDREGGLLDSYRVSALSAESESLWSNARHASDCGFDVCNITGHLAEINGTKLSGIRVSYRIYSAPYMSGNTLGNAYEAHVYTDEFGQFYLSLPKGSDCLIKIDQAGFRERVKIPYVDSIDFDALLKLNAGE